MSRKAEPTMLSLMADSLALSLEASCVIWLRSCRMMAGGRLAESEGQRMVSEKLAASASFWPAMFSGGLPTTPESFGSKALEHYARPVRANRRRLASARR